MKVAELTKLLETLDPEAEIVLSSDSEGNSYSPLEGVAAGLWYTPQNSWSGEVYELEEDETEEDLPFGTVPCVVAIPVN